MCGRAIIVNWDELLHIAEAIQSGAVSGASFNYLPDWPAQERAIADGTLREAFPRSIVPVATACADNPDTIVPQQLVWGYAMEGKHDVVFNTRLETAADTPLWRDSFLNRHCVMPVWAFFEPHGTEQAISPRSGRKIKQLYRFTEPEGQLMLLAGIWRQDRFSVLTTQPNMAVKPVHNRMPVVMDLEGARNWLVEGGLPQLSPQADLLQAVPIYPDATRADEPKQGNASDQLSLNSPDQPSLFDI